MELVVARIGAPNGLHGLVRLEVRTDDPAGRLTPGAVLATDPPERGPLTVAASSERQGSWYVRFEEAPDRTAAEALRGTLLLAAPEEGAEEDAWYPHELVGLPVEDTEGRHLGTVAGIEYLPAQDLLVLTETGGQRTLVPFVAEIVPVVDVPGRRVVLDPPRGLLAGDDDED
ncbi:16S rRNA processing protein RimM [Georgenia satyanarayanai]|uniref:Ribosome maturation factor RimM n=1 Tax=Georgenia satyanarayanai TaxID=860221 RepID=A0A2Y9ACA4_9MICO|nr:ribosome maturation factor RimM [Georgenia satyanarayanai]PYF99918.1 16S rRNA processing protein RimM [Georgenia satyanarayanai]SSA41920.1 16S rRNA processing protein RimM [Georgenia satyanarayanai]